MPRFGIKDLLISITLASAGLGCFTAATTIPLLENPLALVLHVSGGALIGAGLLYPFKIAWAGAILGVLAILGLLAYVVAMTPI
jgi:hypothetical protein